MIAVIFEVEPTAEGRAAYFNHAALLKPLPEGIDRFISVERFQSLANPHLLLSLSFWRDEAAVRAWHAQGCHREAQAAGCGGLFHDYRLRVSAVVCDYGLHERGQVPLS
jgi:heme-degrading monooxygenase HmoA